MNKLRLLLLLCLSFWFIQSEAQNFMSVHFNYMQPLDDYRQNMNVHPKGIGLGYQFKPKIFKKFYIGAQFGVSMYAMDSYLQSIETDEDVFEDVEIEEEDCFLAYHLTGRYYFVEERRINPYLEARLGGLSFFSTKMTDEEYDEYFENSTSFYGTSIQAGIGGGLSFHIVDQMWIDFNVIYNRGSRADYRNIDSVKDASYRIDPELSKFESYTNNVNYSLGVQFSF